jgi:hypothetical protein
MTTRTRQVSAPAYYLGRPASLWISVARRPRRRRSAPGNGGTRIRRKSC